MQKLGFETLFNYWLSHFMSFLNIDRGMRRRREQGGESENVKELHIAPDFPFLLELKRVLTMGLVMEKWQ